MSTDAVHPVKSYVLRGGRITRAQEAASRELSPRFCVPFTHSTLDMRAIFGSEKPVVCEIGFGMGGATADIAEANPDTNYLGIEVFKAGVGKLLWEIDRRGLENIRIIERDAVEVFDAMIPAGAFAGIHLFFPDPWQKKRHHKRRLVRRPFTLRLAEKLAPRGYLFMLTDWEDYALDARAELEATPAFRSAGAGFAAPLRRRPTTKFERKGIAQGRSIFELCFIRQSEPQND